MAKLRIFILLAAVSLGACNSVPTLVPAPQPAESVSYGPGPVCNADIVDDQNGFDPNGVYYTETCIWHCATWTESPFGPDTKQYVQLSLTSAGSIVGGVSGVQTQCQ